MNIDTDQLIENIGNGTNIFEDMVDINIKGRSYKYETGNINFDEAIHRIEEDSLKTEPGYLTISQYVLPDIITHLQNDTKLTYKSIIQILTQSNNLEKFKLNPINHMMQATRIIIEHKI